MTLAHQIKTLREDAGLTQSQLAAIANVSEGYIGMLESGQRSNPRRQMITRIAEALNADPDSLTSISAVERSERIPEAIRADMTLTPRAKAALIELFELLRDYGDVGTATDLGTCG